VTMSLLPLPSSPSRWQRALFPPLTILAWLLVAIVAGWLLGHVLHTVVIVVLAGILAFALAPLVALLRRFLTRPVAVALAYLLSMSVIVGMGTLLVVTAANQVVTLVQNLPGYSQQIRDLEPRLLGPIASLGGSAATLQSINQQILASAQTIGAALAAGSLGFVTSIAGALVDAVLILMLSIYFTIAGPRVGRWLQDGTPESVRQPARFLVQTVNQVVGGYIRGTLTMAALIGLLVGLGLRILGVPYAVLLGVLAFFMEFVPVVGVLISGAVSLAVTLPLGSLRLLLVLIYFVVVHVIESDVVGPRIMGRAVGIHPATGIIALLAGTELFGAWGALFASPIAGLLQAILLAVWQGVTDDRRTGLLSAAVAPQVKVVERAPIAREPPEGA
jgi:predicted PurR-regulated permease PerM